MKSLIHLARTPGRWMPLSISALLTGAGIAISAPAYADPALEVLIRDVGEHDPDGAILVDLRVLNGGNELQPFPLPDRMEARLDNAGNSRTIWLERAADVPSSVIVPPGGFVRARYHINAGLEHEADGAELSIPAWNIRPTSIALRPVPAAVQLAEAPSSIHAEPGNVPKTAPPLSDRSAGNAFLANLSAYEPIYAVYGPGTNTEARIQFSFKYQLFGSRRTNGAPHSWRDGLHFAYTQRMFWDLGAHSSPFRNVDYQPELIYVSPSATLSSGISLNAQGGIRHESNGLAGTQSRSINTIYIAPMAAVPLGGGHRLSISPRLSFFVGDKSDNPDISRYRGNTSLFLQVGKDDGLRLTTSARLNFESGKGGISNDISYPLPRLLGGGADLYVFGQSFIGYGENLLDYNIRTNRFRLGVALVR